MEKNASLINKIIDYSKSNNIPIILDDALDLLIETIKNNQSKNILEIGTAIGYSAIQIATHCDIENLITLDIDTKRIKQANKNIKKAGLTDKIKVINTDALVWLEYYISDKDKLADTTKNVNKKLMSKQKENSRNSNTAKKEKLNEKDKFDLIFLDGPKGQYVKYLPYLLAILKTNGIIFADNVLFKGMVKGIIPTPKSCKTMVNNLRKYLEAVINNPKLNSKVIEIGDGVCITKKL